MHIAAVIGAALLLGLATVAVNRQSALANSATWDESIYMALGRAALSGDASAQFADLGVAPLPVRAIWTRSVLEPLVVAPGDAAVFAERVNRARLRAIAIVAVPLVISLLLWTVRAQGALAGVTATAVVALSPNVIAHSSLATTDAAFALTFILSVVALIAYARVRSWSRSIALAAALGTALATKYSEIGRAHV